MKSLKQVSDQHKLLFQKELKAPTFDFLIQLLVVILKSRQKLFTT